MKKLAGAAALSVVLALAGCSGKDAAPAEGDMALGVPEGAKVTVVEYASFACNHCADWHRFVYPTFKTRFIDTGQVRLVFRNLPTLPEEMSLPGAALARCAARAGSTRAPGSL